jgi:hypothetical protein
VPLVNPEKYASAIEQKKRLPGSTSAKGIVMLAIPQVPVVASKRVGSKLMLTINKMSSVARIGAPLLILIRFSSV